MNNTETGKTALILGATGGIGAEIALALLRRHWTIRVLARSPAPADAIYGNASQCDWRIGDALNHDDVMNAARDVDVIVHAVNPPGYRNWDKLVLPMIDNTIAAATVNKARIVLPGTIYNYGPDALPEPGENSPQNPITRKGAIRVAIEERLKAACDYGAKALIVRAGDFFGPTARNNWFSQCLVKPATPVTKITYPGKSGIGHQWAYLPDVAETMAQLLCRETELDDFARFHMAGYWDHDGQQMINAIRRVSGQQSARVAALPWNLMKLAKFFVPFFREATELHYLWQQPIRLNNQKLVSFLGSEPHTDLDVAITRTLRMLGCMEIENPKSSLPSEHPST